MDENFRKQLEENGADVEGTIQTVCKDISFDIFQEKW